MTVEEFSNKLLQHLLSIDDMSRFSINFIKHRDVEIEDCCCYYINKRSTRITNTNRVFTELRFRCCSNGEINWITFNGCITNLEMSLALLEMGFVKMFISFANDCINDHHIQDLLRYKAGCAIGLKRPDALKIILFTDWDAITAEFCDANWKDPYYKRVMRCQFDEDDISEWLDVATAFKQYECVALLLRYKKEKLNTNNTGDIAL